MQRLRQADLRQVDGQVQVMDEDMDSGAQRDLFDVPNESTRMVKEFDDQLKSRLAFCEEMVKRHRTAADGWEKEAAIINQYRETPADAPKPMPERSRREDAF